MAQNKITIQFQGRGHKKLRDEINAIAAAQERLNGKVDDGVKAGNGALRNNRLLGNSFATMRSHLLLFNFAMGLGIRQLGQFAKEAGRVQDMERAFTNLSGGTENASIAVDKLTQATNETMSEFDLFQQANNAMILGVSKNSDEMAHMFDVAQRLGAALGKDTKQSVESLITGIGRQSRLMLDNIGIIVKSDEAYQDYADRIGVTKDQLTDTQKKQAFLNATMEAAELKLESVGSEVISYNAKLQIATARMANMRAEIGKALLPSFSALAVHFTDTNIIMGYRVAIDVLIITFVTLRAKIIAAAIANGTFINSIKIGRKALIASGYGVAFIALGELIGRFVIGKEKTDELTESTRMLNHEYLIVNNITNKFSDQLQKQIALAKGQTQAFSMLLDPFESLRNMYSQTEEGQLEQLNTQIALIESLGGFTEKNKDLSAVYSRLLEQRDKLLKQDKDTKDSFEEISFGAKIANNSIGMVASEMARLVIEGKSLSKLKLGDVLGQMALSMAFTGLLGGGVGAMFGGGFKSGAFGALGIAHTGGHIKEDGSVQRFATGGVVQGQDNVPILAQAGEFVMRRSAVESVGIEAMNRINQGGGAGSVVINVSGNVMSQDYVEGELADQLKTAIRRGADIGVS
tara:strand:+ start:372 stop:2270 length:1899 start_codon:yes stop_codon:yes gene_type:complete